MTETGKGGAPRTAVQIHWDPKVAKGKNGMWGCWACGNEDSRVKETDLDEEHVRVRLRQCVRCGEHWETEERRITKGSFFSRSERRRYRAFQKTRFKVRDCHVCEEKYAGGRYLDHTQESSHHIKTVAKIEARKHRRVVKYQREWTRAKREIERASRSKAKCERCGGLYDLGKHDAHTKTEKHQRVIRAAANERKRERRKAV